MFASYVPRNAFSAWHDPSYDVIGQMLGGSGSWNFQGKRRKDGRKAIQRMVTIKRLTKKIFQKNRRGGCINPLCRRGLTLLLVWGGGRIGPPASCSALSENGLSWGLEFFWLFLHIHWECCTNSLSFYFAQRRLHSPGPLSRGHVCQVSTNFSFKCSESVKIWLCVMDLFIEKLVLKFGRSRSRNNEVITILNIWWKNGECYFWPLEPQIFGFFGFSKTYLVVHDERNRMAFRPLKSALRFSRSHGGSNRPPSPVNTRTGGGSENHTVWRGGGGGGI